MAQKNPRSWFGHGFSLPKMHSKGCLRCVTDRGELKHCWATFANCSRNARSWFNLMSAHPKWEDYLQSMLEASTWSFLTFAKSPKMNILSVYWFFYFPFHGVMWKIITSSSDQKMRGGISVSGREQLGNESSPHTHKNHTAQNWSSAEQFPMPGHQKGPSGSQKDIKIKTGNFCFSFQSGM